MSTDTSKGVSSPGRPIEILDLNFVSLYIEDFSQAIEFYEQVFGPPETVDEAGGIYGWRMGATWLTLFPSEQGSYKGSNPRNAEFAIQVAKTEEVDVLHDILVNAGAKSCWAPEDTNMYEDMRFSCVDDPFGVRIDIYCLLEDNAG